MGKSVARGRRPDEPQRVKLGFGDLYASKGDHIAHFYQDREEWKHILVPFLKMGLEAGEKCICLVQPGSATQELRDAMRAAGVDVQGACASNQLIIDEGRNSPQEMTGLPADRSGGSSGDLSLASLGGRHDVVSP